MDLKKSTTAREKKIAATKRKTEKNDKYNAALKDELAKLQPKKNGVSNKRIAVI